MEKSIKENNILYKYSKELNIDKNLSSLVKSLNMEEVVCSMCDKAILNKEETIYCTGCFLIFHLYCVKEKKIKIIKLKSVSKYKWECPACEASNSGEGEIIYNCFCGKFYESENDENFDSHSISHSCGLMCSIIICKHLKCRLPCHPGAHEFCTTCNKDQFNKLSNPQKIRQNEKVDTRSNIIVNLKGKINLYGASLEKTSDIIYCGRQNYQGGWKLKQSIWGNPFKVNDFGTNEKACEKYEEYLRDSPNLLEELPNLVGKKLACWCYPDPCHTEVIVKIMKEKGYI
jgi:hypothetical protein